MKKAGFASLFFLTAGIFCGALMLAGCGGDKGSGPANPHMQLHLK